MPFFISIWHLYLFYLLYLPIQLYFSPQYQTFCTIWYHSRDEPSFQLIHWLVYECYFCDRFTLSFRFSFWRFYVYICLKCLWYNFQLLLRQWTILHSLPCIGWSFVGLVIFYYTHSFVVYLHLLDLPHIACSNLTNLWNFPFLKIWGISISDQDRCWCRLLSDNPKTPVASLPVETALTLFLLSPECSPPQRVSCLSWCPWVSVQPLVRPQILFFSLSAPKNRMYVNWRQCYACFCDHFRFLLHFSHPFI